MIIVRKYCCSYVLVKIIDYKVKIITFYVIFVIIGLLTLLWNTELKILTTCVYFKIDFYLLEKSYPKHARLQILVKFDQLSP